MKTDYDLEFEIDENDDSFLVGDLIDKFNAFHHKPRRKALNPISLVLNPETKDGQLWYPDTEIYFAVYYKHFYVTIEKHLHAINGWHRARLFYQIAPGNASWLATAQFKCGFYDRKTIRKKLRGAIIRKLYYASELSRDKIVRLTPETKEERYFRDRA